MNRIGIIAGNFDVIHPGYVKLFKDNNNVIVLKGVDQSRTTVVSEINAITQEIGTNAPGYPKDVSIGKVDGCKIAAGSWYGAWATNIGIDQGDRQYVCILDHDTIFLNSYAVKLLENDFSEYKFISNRWCPGNVFRHIKSDKQEDGIARSMLMLSERAFYDEIAEQNYVEEGIWTSSPWNCDYRDMTGNITWYAKQKDYKVKILKNSYRDRSRPDNKLWKEHALNITDQKCEQAWLDDIPVFFHHGRSGYRSGMHIHNWVSKVEKYLTNNTNKIDRNKLNMNKIDRNKKIVGFTAGNFDLLHPGYIYTFEDARKHCDHFMIFLQRDPSATRFTNIIFS